MAALSVHFAVGMCSTSVLCAGLVVVRRRWLIYVPLLLTLGGLWALVPELVARWEARGAAGSERGVGREGVERESVERKAQESKDAPRSTLYSPPLGPAMNLFFFHPALDRLAWLDGPEMAARAFHLVAFVYLVSACGYVAYIRRRLPRRAESAEALARMRRAVAGYRAVAVLAGLVPLVVTGAAAGWALRGAGPARLVEPAGPLSWESWSQLVASRTRVTPGPHWGVVRALPWAGGEWVSGDLSVPVALGGGPPPLGELLDRAKANGCGFVVLAAGTELGRPERLAAYAAALEAARQKVPEVALLTGLAWSVGRESVERKASSVERKAQETKDAPRSTLYAPPTGLVVLGSGPGERELLAGFCRWLEGGASGGTGVRPEAALEWLGAHSSSLAALPAVFAVRAAGGGGAGGVGRESVEREAQESKDAPRSTLHAPPPGEGSDELFSWLRTNEVFVGLLGLTDSERVSARSARSEWDPRVARVGGAWDQLLSRGFQLWGAGAASGFRDPTRHYWPGEFARTHVWCRSRAPADLLAGLRAGCFWADQGGMVRRLEFTLTAPELARAAQMGEIVCVAPGSAVTVELALEAAANDYAGRASRVDEAELISNFTGEPTVVHTFRPVVSGRRLRFVFPPAADRHGGLGFTVRARGRHRLDDGSELAFYTNPIRVLVREGLELPSVEEPSARRPAVAGAKPREPEPATAGSEKRPKGDASPPPMAAVKLRAMGLPGGLRALQVECFEKPPGREWRGSWAEHVAERGAALGDEKLEVRFIQTTPLGEATRLFFRLYATECARLTLRLHTTASGKPYQTTRELPDRRWVDFDLSLAEDFLPPPGAPAGLRAPEELAAIEWRAEAVSSAPQPAFHITDFAVYEPMPASRIELAKRRVRQAEAALREVQAAPGPSQAWQAKAEAVAARRRAAQDLLDAGAYGLTDDQVARLGRDLDQLLEECRRLRLAAAMARAFAVESPPFVVGIEGPTRRVSARDPARAFRGMVSREVELWAAGDEAESFQVVVLPLWDRLRAVEVSGSALRPEGRIEEPCLPASAVSAHVVSELLVYPRAGLPPDRVGWKADPLLPSLPFDLEPGSLGSVLLTVHVPAELPPGNYEGAVTVRAHGLEPVRLTLRLHRWDFALTEHRFPIFAPIDEGALREQYGDENGVSEAQRRELYELLLRHRVAPAPLLSRDEDAGLADLTFCLERGLSLALLGEAPSAMAGPDDPGVARAARYATKLWEAGWGRRGALLLPRVREADAGERFVASATALGRRWPALHVVAGGEGDPPPGLISTYWRRSLAVEVPQLPKADVVEFRRSRTARREAWELPVGAPDYPQPNLTLVNRLVESRLLPWLAWRHGVRALLLGSVNRWEQNNSCDGLLVYPGPAGPLCGSLRLVALRDGAEDYEFLGLLWDRVQRLRGRSPERHLQLLAAADQVLADVETVTASFQAPWRDPEALAALRVRVGSVVERLEAAWRVELDGAEDLPAPPPALTAKPGDAQVALTWPRSPDEKVGAYQVYRSCDPKAGFTRITPSPVEALSFVDRLARNGPRYYYFVRACREGEVEGPRSPVAEATPRPAPRVVWLPMADLHYASAGPYRVHLRLEGPGTGGVLPLVRPQMDYRLSDGLYDGYEDMERRDDGTWTLDIPGRDWRRAAGGTLWIKVRLVDRRNTEVVPPLERQELIDPVGGPKP